jgi:hypothetical protein
MQTSARRCAPGPGAPAARRAGDHPIFTRPWVASSTCFAQIFVTPSVTRWVGGSQLVLPDDLRAGQRGAAQARHVILSCPLLSLNDGSSEIHGTSTRIAIRADRTMNG